MMPGLAAIGLECNEESSGMEEQTFHALYAATAKPLWTYIARMSRRPDLANDLLQETYCRFLTSQLGKCRARRGQALPVPHRDQSAARPMAQRRGYDMVRTSGTRRRTGSRYPDRRSRSDAAAQAQGAPVALVSLCRGHDAQRNREVHWAAIDECSHFVASRAPEGGGVAVTKGESRS